MARGGPRIRSLKPEIVEDEVTAGLSDAAFRLFVSLIVLSDDYGRVRGNPGWVAAHVWWNVRGEPPRVAEVIAELEAAGRTDTKPGLITRYEVAGQSYLAISGWAKHQRIDNAGSSIIPPPPGASDQVVAPTSAATRGESRRGAASRGSRARARGSLVPDPDPGSKVPDPGSQPPPAAPPPSPPGPPADEPKPAPEPKPEVKAAKDRNPLLKVAIDGFHKLFEASRGSSPTWDGREVKRMEALLARAGNDVEVVLARARVMFASVGQFPVEHGGDLRTLSEHFDRFATARPAPRRAQAPARGLGAAMEAMADLAPNEPWKVP